MDMFSRREIEPSASGFRADVVLIKTAGLVLLVLGVIVSLQVVNKAWEIYDAPETIDSFALVIEESSQINEFAGQVYVDLISRLPNRSIPAKTKMQAAPPADDAAASPPEQRTVPASPLSAAAPSKKVPLNIAYFVAWGIVLILLALLCSIGLSITGKGGQLLLYRADEYEKFFKQLVYEIRAQQEPVPPPLKNRY